MKIEFAGAARNVTGSKHLLHINGQKILLDCGLFQGRRKVTEQMNRHFPFDAKEIDAVVLSHAHIDHSGALPQLARLGFEGPVFCTHATHDLCKIMLADSAHIQSRDAEWLNKKKKTANAEPLYRQEHVDLIMSQMQSVAYAQWIPVAKGVRVRFTDAGHILGSALVELEITDHDTHQDLRLGFTGDLGRFDLPILRDPRQLTDIDVFITESTYGNRLHNELAEVEDLIAQHVTATFERGGKIITPAFSVGRTQEVLYVMRQLIKQGKIPHFPIFVDSPLSNKATRVFSVHPECFDSELTKLLEAGHDPFCYQCEGVQYLTTVEESKAINQFPGPAMVISSSGMAEFGRIRHHLANQVSNPQNLIMCVGFMAENTLGRKIAEKQTPVKIFGDEYPLNAEVLNVRAFSGHADQHALLGFAGKTGSPTQVFLVHGEDEPMLEYQSKLQQLPNLQDAIVDIPSPGEMWELGPNKRWTKLPTVNPISQQYIIPKALQGANASDPIRHT